MGRRFASVVGAAVVLAVAGIDSGAAYADEPRRDTGSLAGKLLVATTKIRDPRFMRTVIYMVRHDATGAMGLVLNRPMEKIPLARVLQELGIESQDVSGTVRMHYGGPVQRSRGFVLHTADYVGRSTVVVDDTVAMTSDSAVWRDVALGTGPRRSRLVLGHSGWAPGQLETEIRAGHWVAVPADEELVFDDDYDGKWPRAMARRRITL